MKKIIYLTVLFLISLPLAAFDFKNCTIIYPDKPQKLEKMAADDLGNFLSLMSNSKIAVKPESQAQTGKNVYIGNTRFAAKNKVDCKNFGKEEWIYRQIGDDLVINGGYPVGAFYGAWNILNKLGCWSLWIDQVSVPKLNDLNVKLDTKVHKPSFAGRMIYDGLPGRLFVNKSPLSFRTAYGLHRLRSGINGCHSKRHEVNYYCGDMFNFSHFPTSHTLCLYVDPNKYFASNPEYFAMNAQGKRVKPRTKYVAGCLCMTNPDVRRITLESLRQMIKKDRSQKGSHMPAVLYDISILDVSPELCLCPSCKKFTDKHGKSGLLIDYVNEIARKIVKEYPDIMIRTLAYSAAADYPKGIKPEKNVVIQIADQFPKSDAFRPLTSKFNKDTSAYLVKWGKICNNLAVWDYWNLGNTYFNPPRVETVVNAIIEDMKFFKKNNFTSLFIEAGYDMVSPQNFVELHYFLGSALMMDVDRDPEKLIDIFFEHFYGPCAPQVRAMFDEIRKGILKHPTRKTILTAANWAHFTQEMVLKHYLNIKKAAEKLPKNNVYRLRAEKELITPVWAALVKRVSFEPYFKANKIDMDVLKKECEEAVFRNLKENLKVNRFDLLKKDFNKKFSRISTPVATPAEFSKLPIESIRVLGWPQAFAPKHLNSAIVNDPESETGKALKSSRPDPKQHGVKGIFIYRGNQKFPATRFVLGNVGRPNPLRMHLKKVPQDEKYHWYKMPGIIDLDERSCFWGHGWAIQFDTTPLYVRSDGVADNNKWECFFHAKFTGPAYVPGSKKENAIYVDYVVLARPGLKNISPDSWK